VETRVNLSRNARHARVGFTIIEVIVIVVILGVIAAVIAPRLLNKIGQSKQSVARANASSLATAMKLFQADHGLPDPGSTIDVLWEKPANVQGDWQPGVDNAEALMDPWGRKFLLVIPGEKNIDFDIVSYGSDGQPGGEGEAADIRAP
jgi:general secretion pathway protein G